MNVNGVTQTADVYQAYKSTEKDVKATDVKEEKGSSVSETGVVYEASDASKSSKGHKVDKRVIAQLQQDSEARLNQLQDLVSKLISKQGGAFADAKELWNALREGKVEVDPATKAQAQEDISEDGYWGVKQTSDRIIDFAVALCGDNPEKLSKMKEAFEKGYKQAEKTWGGELPDICKKTYDTVLEKFDNMINGEN